MTAGTGLKPLDVASDWLEQDGEENDGDSNDEEESNWIREMRLRHELIKADCGCTVWVRLHLFLFSVCFFSSQSLSFHFPLILELASPSM